MFVPLDLPELFSRKTEKFNRPAQNCAKRYGYGMQLNEIVTLSETDYEERPIRSIFPDWASDLRTTHTINKSEKTNGN